MEGIPPRPGEPERFLQAGCSSCSDSSQKPSLLLTTAFMVTRLALRPLRVPSAERGMVKHCGSGLHKLGTQAWRGAMSVRL